MLVTEAGSAGTTTSVRFPPPLPNVSLTSIVEPGAKELATVYKNAGSPKQVRGFSTNVAGWNSYDQSPGEFSKATDAQYNKAQNEKLYVSMFSPELKSAGMPSQAIIDTGRNAVTGLRVEWGDWCNVSPAGYGSVPTTETDNKYIDSLVWIKPGGESDGECGLAGAPQAGVWFDEYVQMLVSQADPPLKPTYK